MCVCVCELPAVMKGVNKLLSSDEWGKKKKGILNTVRAYNESELLWLIIIIIVVIIDKCWHQTSIAELLGIQINWNASNLPTCSYSHFY